MERDGRCDSTDGDEARCQARFADSETAIAGTLFIGVAFD